MVVGSLPLRADRLGEVLAVAGGLSAGLLVLGLALRWTGALPWAYAVAGSGYAGFLFLQGGPIDSVAPIYAGGLLLSAELAYWSLERPVHGSQPGRRVALVLTAVLVGGGVAGIVLTASELSVHGGLALEVLGVAAAVGALGLIARLSRPDPPQ